MVLHNLFNQTLCNDAASMTEVK